MTPDVRQSAIVLGAGPAGLTAAYRLAVSGCQVTLLSSSSLPGQQLRRAGDPPSPILGCHHATWALLRTLRVQRSPSAFAEATLEFLLPDGRFARYPKTWFPTPLRQLLTIGRFAGLPPSERWKLLTWLEQLWEGSLDLPPDLEQRTAQQWLESLGYSPASLQSVWNRLAGWLTGNDLGQLSADAFVMALKPFFLSGGANSRIWVPRLAWDRLIIEPIKEALIKNRATVTTPVEAVRFEIQEDRVSGVRLRDGTVLRADWYVSAVGAPQLTPLLPERWLTRYAYFQHLVDLQTFPRRVIHACTAATLTAPRQILPSSGAFQWIACMPSNTDQPVRALLAVAHDRPVANPEQEATSLLRALKLLRADERLTGFSDQITASAALSLAPGTKIRRPLQRSPIANLLLAGAWTDTGWPANVESAIISGERCAEIIVHGGTRAN